MKVLKREDGQSVIMVVFILVVLIALVALVLDVGNAYAQRRVVQNAADAAAMAATRELARGVQVTTNRKVLDEAKLFTQLNGVDPQTVEARYFSFNPDTQATTDLGVVPNTSTRPPADADGVTVSVGKTFDTYLAQVVGRDVLAASAESFGQISTGACTAGGGGSGLFPIAFNVALFDNERDNGIPTVGATYRLWAKEDGATGKGQDHSPLPPGNFGWLSWDNDPSNPTLVNNMNDTTRSGEWSIGDEIPGGPGVMNSQNVKDALDVRIADTDSYRPKEVLLPIFDTTTGEGNHALYHVVGFAWFVLTDYDFQGNDKWVEGYFIEDAVPVAEGGCMDFGTKTVKLRPSMDLSRSIAGNVAFEYLKIVESTGGTQKPVDVVNVIDISGSMNDKWGSGNSKPKKIDTAKSVLQEFNNMLDPEIGDRAALVKYPYKLTNAKKSYYKSCGGTSKELYTGQVVQNLTSDIELVNSKIRNLTADGWTPIAGAMQKGVEAALDPAFHDEDHIPIIVFASDGMGNVMLDGKLTGWDGRTPTEPTCNTPASADGIDMANQGKMSGVTLFTVGIGNFLTYVLESMATPDTNPEYPHFLQASDPESMEQIYASLGSRITNFEECVIQTQDAAANGAVVALYKNGSKVAQVYADAAGNFLFNDVEPGTYTFLASIVRDDTTYDVFTNKVGGYELDSPPELVVEEAAGTYSIHLSLKTDNPPVCDL